jgi:hypothetical protein
MSYDLYALVTYLVTHTSILTEYRSTDVLKVIRIPLLLINSSGQNTLNSKSCSQSGVYPT